MPNDGARGDPSMSDGNGFGIPTALLGVWNPWLVGAAKCNTQIYEGFGTLASEWQNFVSSRLKENFVFMQRIAQCRMPDQVWAAHTDFWQKAVEDYGKEYMLMGRLAASLTTKAAATAQSASQEASAEIRALSRAA